MKKEEGEWSGREERLEASLVQSFCQSFYRITAVGKLSKSWEMQNKERVVNFLGIEMNARNCKDVDSSDAASTSSLVLVAKKNVRNWMQKIPKVWIPVMLLVLPSSLLITDVIVGEQVFFAFLIIMMMMMMMMTRGDIPKKYGIFWEFFPNVGPPPPPPVWETVFSKKNAF